MYWYISLQFRSRRSLAKNKDFTTMRFVSWSNEFHGCAVTGSIRSAKGTFELVLSNRGGMSYTAINEYMDSLIIKAGLKEAGTLVHDIRIAAGTMDAGKVLTFSRGDRMGLQVADAVASGFYNALEARYGFTEDRYARMLKPILYNYRDWGRYRGYGLEFFPAEAEKLIETDARLK